MVLDGRIVMNLRHVCFRRVEQDMKKCYICRNELKHPHDRYLKMCLTCGEENYQKRITLENMTGYVALVTGARIKIGYYTSLRLLRSGAKVIATTRFPMSALQKYAKEPDFSNWKDRLYLCQLDLKHLSEVEIFIEYVKKEFGKLDIIINNAAQTIRKGRAYYESLEAEEKKLLCGEQLFQGEIGTLYLNNSLSMATGKTDIVQFREEDHTNSWTSKPEDITLCEFLEVQVINVTAPFMLCSGLKECLLKSNHPNKFIINVTSVEGSFSEKKKSSKHLHTNMAKASLNMITKSMGKDLAKEHIFIYSVDPGWVSNQFPKNWNGICDESFEAPLTYEDAAARICDPVFMHKDDVYVKEFGVIYKDYKKWEW